MVRRRLQRGQSTLEIALLFAAVGAALLAINIYVNRGIQGKLKDSADNIGQQYHAGLASGSITQTSNSDTRETIAGGVTTNTVNEQKTTVTGNEKILGYDKAAD